MSKLFFIVFLLLSGCAGKEFADLYGLERNLEQNQNYGDSIKKMETRYKTEVDRKQGNSESSESAEKSTFKEFLSGINPFTKKKPDKQF